MLQVGQIDPEAQAVLMEMTAHAVINVMPMDSANLGTTINMSVFSHVKNVAHQVHVEQHVDVFSMANVDVLLMASVMLIVPHSLALSVMNVTLLRTQQHGQGKQMAKLAMTTTHVHIVMNAFLDHVVGQRTLVLLVDLV